MYVQLKPDDLSSIAFFIKNNGLGSNPNYAITTNRGVLDFKTRKLRSRFFRYTIIAYGDFDDDDPNLLKDLIIYYKPECVRATYIKLVLSPKNNPEFLMYSVNDLFDKNEKYTKIKIIADANLLNHGYERLWKNIGFKCEACLRQFEDSNKNYYSLAFTREVV